MLFKDITILDEDFAPRTHMYVGVKDDTICYIGGSMPEQDFGEAYDGNGNLLMSGFVNNHSHTPMMLMRGYGENMMLQDWLEKKIFPFEDRLTGQDVYYATLLGIAEMVRFGTVSTTDMYFFCHDIARAFADSGVKANIGRAITAFGDTDLFSMERFQEAKALYNDYHGAENGRILVDMSLHGEYTSNPQIARQLAEYTKSIGANMHVHVSETSAETEECTMRHGKTPTKYLAELGLFDGPATAAHCVWLTPEDMDILAEKNVAVASCPVSNLKLASGICDVPALMERGVNITLGTDSVASNNNLNMLEEIKLFAILHKGATHNPTLISPKQALQAATVNGARAQGRMDCGLLKEGNKADLIVVDLSAPHMQPVHSAQSNLVYSAVGGDVRLTMVDGVVVYKDGVYPTIDIDKVLFEVGESNKRILGELG